MKYKKIAIDLILSSNQCRGALMAHLDISDRRLLDLLNENKDHRLFQDDTIQLLMDETGLYREQIIEVLESSQVEAQDINNGLPVQ